VDRVRNLRRGNTVTQQNFRHEGKFATFKKVPVAPMKKMCIVTVAVSAGKISKIPALVGQYATPNWWGYSFITRLLSMK